MRDIIEVDRLWLVVVAGIIAFGLTIQTIFTIYVLVVDSIDEILPFLFFISISILQGGAIGYLIAFYMISRKFMKYDNLIVKSKEGLDNFMKIPKDLE